MRPSTTPITNVNSQLCYLFSPQGTSRKLSCWQPQDADCMLVDRYSPNTTSTNCTLYSVNLRSRKFFATLGRPKWTGEWLVPPTTISATDTITSCTLYSANPKGDQSGQESDWFPIQSSVTPIPLVKFLVVHHYNN